MGVQDEFPESPRKIERSFEEIFVGSLAIGEAYGPDGTPIKVVNMRASEKRHNIKMAAFARDEKIRREQSEESGSEAS